MRFGFLVAVVVAGGALVGASAQSVLAPSSGSLSSGSLSSGSFAGGPSQKSTWAKFDIADLNPIRLIYDAVMKEVATDANRPSFAVGTPAPVADFSKMDAQIRINNEKFQRMSNPGDFGPLPENAPR